MHIARIFGTNRAGELLTDIWCDVLRIDKLKINTQNTLNFPNPKVSNRGQEVTLDLKWRDDNGQQEDTSQTRETAIVKVCGPDEDPTDPDEWVPIETIKRVHMAQGNVATWRQYFNSLLQDKNRLEVEIRRFVHYNTNIDDRAEASGQSVYFISTDDYVMDAASKDDSQYLDHEVALKINTQASPHWAESPAGKDHQTTVIVKNQFLLDASDPGSGAVGDTNNPAWRLDVMENIINCQFGGLAVEFLNGVE